MSFMDLELAKAYHGHLGPNLVIGIKLGNYAVKALGARKHFGIESQVFCAARPPVSCVIDGVQLSSGCTMGKANINHVVGDGPVRVVFTNTDTGQKIALQVVDGLMEKAGGWIKEMGEEQASSRVWELGDDQVFQVCEA